MNGPRIGSLFSGYGGLDMGVTAAIGGSVAWHVEYDKAPSKILAHHWPDVPNYGDVTKVDWSAVEPVDVITGGSPCQDLSHAGKRQGMTEGTRSNLWVAMREAIAQLRPSLVVWENVRGAASAEATSEVEFCPGCMGEGRLDSGPVLRALGRVVGDLADLGYVGRVWGLRAADVGAPHGRFRFFLAATDARGLRRGAWWPTVAGEAARGWASADLAGRGNTPTSNPAGARLSRPSRGGLQRGREPGECGSGRVAFSGGSLELERTGALGSVRPDLNLLPTPQAHDAKQGGGESAAQRSAPGRFPNPALADIAHLQWGIYADAIARWEALTRPAPAPTRPSKKGTPQLSPAFSEWMMGLPAGHVTDVPGLSRNDMLKALGNGVVPQQAAAALRFLLNVQAVAA